MTVCETHNYVTVDGTIHHNSTKTSAGMMKILYHASRMAPCRDGIRRSRAVWIRNTREQLFDTSIPDFLKWFPDGLYGQYVKTSGTRYYLRVSDVECEVLFRGLDDANDVRRLLSLQASFAIVEEFREINPDIFEAVQTRLGRYPDGSMVSHRPEWGVDAKGNPIQGCVTDDGKANKHIWGMSNPPDSDTYWEALLTNPPSNFRVYMQPSGISPEADWVHLLPSNYYEDMSEGKSQDFVDVYVHAKFGKSLAGKPVFQAFDRVLHVAKEPLRILPTPLLIGVDAGLNPTAVIGQVAYDSRLLVHSALTGVSGGMGALRFIREILKPHMANKFPGVPYTVVIDPAAFTRAQTDERTVADIFKQEGFPIKAASTNTISARISSVDNYLTRMVDGKPAIMFDPKDCEGLLEAIRSKYRYKRKTSGEYDEVPEKNHPWSDYLDSLQYLCLQASGGGGFGSAINVMRREIKPPPYRFAM